MPAPPYGSPSPYPDSPAAFSPLTISNSDRKTEDRTLSIDIKTYSAPLFESGDFSLFQKQKSDELSVAVGKVLSLFLFVEFEFVGEEMSAGESGYGAGEHAFARNAAQRYIRAQRTRSKCRRRFTAPHHHTRTPRLRFYTHNFRSKEETKAEL